MEDAGVSNSKIYRTDISHMLKCEMKLLKQKAWLEKTIETIKEQRIALQVEHLNLENILFEEIKKLSSPDETNEQNLNNECDESIPAKKAKSSVEEMDSAKSSMNTKTLDLSIVTLIDDIIQQDYSEESASENEYEIPLENM